MAAVRASHEATLASHLEQQTNATTLTVGATTVEANDVAQATTRTILGGADSAAIHD
jgi:hypothetical protein